MFIPCYKERIQQWPSQYSALYDCFEANTPGLDDVSNNRLKCAGVSGIRLSFNYNL